VKRGDAIVKLLEQNGELEDKLAEPTISEQKLNQLAQYLYEEIALADTITLQMNMSDKPRLVAAVQAALGRIGIKAL
jgi:hypothetical protein